LKEHGYATAAVQSNANLQPLFEMNRGFDTYFFQPYPSFRGERVTNKAIELAGSLHGPYFLYVHYMEPHRPYDPPQRYLDGFSLPEGLSTSDEDLLGDFGKYYGRKIAYDIGRTDSLEPPLLSDAAKEHVRALYDGDVRYADVEVHRLIQHLRARDPECIIVVTSDHGEELWEHDSVGHGKTLYQEVVHVPLIVSVPGKAPRSVDTWVALLDVVPTFASLAQLPRHEDWQGRDLSVEPIPAVPAYTMTKTSLPVSDTYLESVLFDGVKLIRDRVNETSQLYDLIDDLGEQHGLADPEKLAALTERLDKHRAQNGAHAAFSKPDFVEIDEATRETLEAQGYL
jgi:arylsulfatase A-like enzyme